MVESKMKILLYIIGIKLFILYILFISIFTEYKEIHLNSNFSDGEAFLFKTFIIDAAVGN